MPSPAHRCSTCGHPMKHPYKGDWIGKECLRAGRAGHEAKAVCLRAAAKAEAEGDLGRASYWLSRAGHEDEAKAMSLRAAAKLEEEGDLEMAAAYLSDVGNDDEAKAMYLRAADEADKSKTAYLRAAARAGIEGDLIEADRNWELADIQAVRARSLREWIAGM